MVSTKLHKFKKVFVVCLTENVNKFYSNIVDDEFIMDCYEETWVDKLINKMPEINSNKQVKERKNILLFLDDVVADRNFYQSSSLKTLFVSWRHKNIAIILTFQYLHSIPPVAKIVLVFIYRSNE